MRRIRLYVLLLTCCLIGHVSAIAQESLEVSKRANAEKIYIQLNNLIYSEGQTIWFKAIVAHSADHRLSAISNVLYVELIDFDERIVDRKKLKLRNGIGKGFFELRKSYQPGRYLVRAYTEWNKNFNEDFIFSEYVELTKPEKTDVSDKAIRNIVLTEIDGDSVRMNATIHPRSIDPKFRGKLQLFIEVDGLKDSVILEGDKKKGYQLNYVVSKNTYQTKLKLALDGIKVKNNKIDFVNSFSETIIVDRNKFDLQFFPEGGQIIHNADCVVAFKAINFNGKGVPVSGVIVDNYDRIITEFKSNDLGMGTVMLKGDVHNQYFAKITSGNREYKYPLPNAMLEGYALKVASNQDHLILTIQSNHTKNKHLSINVEGRGVRHHQFELEHKSHLSKASIPKKILPEGIVKITILDERLNPVCERLVFNLANYNRLMTDINTFEGDYGQREKVTLNITTKNQNNGPEIVSASVLVMDKDAAESEATRPNILSFFLLNSELKGAVENPNYYFQSDNLNRIQDLDVLMLTQGWRSYKYQEFNKDYNYQYAAEKGLYVSGSIGELLKKTKQKKKKEVDLTLMAFGDPNQVFTEKVDSTGTFHFTIDDTYKDELRLVFQTNKQNGKKKDFTINIDKQKTPPILYDEKEAVLTADTLASKRFTDKLALQNEITSKFELADNIIQLDEVELTDYELTPQRKKMMGLHGSPDVVIEDKELHQEIKKWSYGLFSVLLFSYPDDIMIRRVGSLNNRFQLATAIGSDFSFIIIDGIPVRIEDYPQIGSLPTEEIKSVEIIRSPKNSRKYVNQVFGYPVSMNVRISFINIYTYSKKGFFGVQRTTGIDKKIIQGFSPVKEFYVPKYDTLEVSDWNIPDIRPVVYWNPNIVTDHEGKATVEYYNGDNTGEMLVILEAITSDGKIGYKQFPYTVTESLSK